MKNRKSSAINHSCSNTQYRSVVCKTELDHSRLYSHYHRKFYYKYLVNGTPSQYFRILINTGFHNKMDRILLVICMYDYTLRWTGLVGSYLSECCNMHMPNWPWCSQLTVIKCAYACGHYIGSLVFQQADWLGIGQLIQLAIGASVVRRYRLHYKRSLFMLAFQLHCKQCLTQITHDRGF